jgi:hypothetical protein
VTYGGNLRNRIFVLYWRCSLIRVSVIRGSTVLIVSPRQQWLRERASVLRYTYIACLFDTYKVRRMTVFAGCATSLTREDCPMAKTLVSRRDNGRCSYTG